MACEYGKNAHLWFWHKKNFFFSKKNPGTVAENNIVYNSEWLLMRNTSVITKQNNAMYFLTA